MVSEAATHDIVPLMCQREVCTHEVYKFVKTKYKYMGMYTPFPTDVIWLLEKDIISNICNLVLLCIFGNRIRKMYVVIFSTILSWLQIGTN
jgi:hypothetical protein